MINQNSIDDLNTRIEKQSSIENFRPNIVVSGFKAYEEDKLKKIKIGKQLFEVVSKCPRCSMTSITFKDSSKNNEILKALSQYKRQENNVYFGIYLKPINEEVLHKGDKIEIIE